MTYPAATVDYFVRTAPKHFRQVFESLPAFVQASIHDMPASAKRQRTSEGLESREVPASALSDWYLALPDIMTPQQVSTILRASLAGNLWQFSQLVLRMTESWPTFRKCATELRTAVKRVNYKVSPYVQEGEEPTDSAEEKAKFVHRCFHSFEPDRFKDEDAFKGMVFDLTDAVLIGLSVTELIWDLKADGPDGPERRVRASAWVHPRHYGVTADGGVGVADEGRGDPLMFHSVVDKRIRNNPNKYLVARYKSKSGSCLGAGEARALALCWVNIMYAVDWVRNSGQKFGSPFIAIPYTPGIAETERLKFEMAAKRAASLGYLVYPRQSPDQKVEVYPAQNITADNPIRIMVDLAEKWCVQLLLGQTLTSDTGDGGKGGSSYALGAVHAEVKQEKLEAIADWVAEILEVQLAPVLVRQNWGKDAGELPHVTANFTHVETPLEAAQRFGVLTTQCRVPLLAEEVYAGVGLTHPQPGDQVLVNGEIKLLGEAMSDEDKFAQQLDRQVQQAEASMALQAEAQGGGPGGPPQEEEQSMSAHGPLTGDRLRAVLAQASEGELAELEPMVVKAKESNNGEWSEVVVKVKELAGKSRIKFL